MKKSLVYFTIATTMVIDTFVLIFGIFFLDKVGMLSNVPKIIAFTLAFYPIFVAISAMIIVCYLMAIFKWIIEIKRKSHRRKRPRNHWPGMFRLFIKVSVVYGVILLIVGLFLNHIVQGFITAGM